MIEDLGGAWARLEDRLIDSELLKIFEEMGEIGGVWGDFWHCLILHDWEIWRNMDENGGYKEFWKE